jgi:hypothetical protein
MSPVFSLNGILSFGPFALFALYRSNSMEVVFSEKSVKLTPFQSHVAPSGYGFPDQTLNAFDSPSRPSHQQRAVLDNLLLTLICVVHLDPQQFFNPPQRNHSPLRTIIQLVGQLVCCLLEKERVEQH